MMKFNLKDDTKRGQIMWVKQLKVILTGTLIMSGMLSLSGCADMNSTFDCPLKAGVMCKSVDQLNGMVDKGELGRDDDTGSNCPDCKKGDSKGKDAKPNSPQLTDFNTPYPSEGIAQPGQPVRYGETVIRIWVAPFQDSQGTYHQESTEFKVVKPGHWIGAPVDAISNDSY